MLTEELNETVLALPAEERIELARRLVESVVWPATLNKAVTTGIRRIGTGRTAGLTEEEKGSVLTIDTDARFPALSGHATTVAH
ncbi:MAG: hypothetical protein HZA90_08690 [Verrucomicrobia bacterium]|nr:hypothetical protein [Verrucomicrobiota bacterium]